MEAFNAIYDEPSLRLVLVRHEQSAAYMADGYARTTGKPAIVAPYTARTMVALGGVPARPRKQKLPADASLAENLRRLVEAARSIFQKLKKGTIPVHGVQRPVTGLQCQPEVTISFSHRLGGFGQFDTGC